MQPRILQRREQRFTQAGMTLLELIIACGILLVLSSAALPLARVTIKRQREAELRRELREMRDSIDRYKNDADVKAFLKDQEAALRAKEQAEDAANAATAVADAAAEAATEVLEARLVDEEQ